MSLRPRLLAALRSRVARLVALVAVALAGASLGVLLLGRVSTPVGPLHTTMTLRPSLVGDTRVDIAPLGTLTLDTHDGPLAIDIRVDSIDPLQARRVFADPSRLAGLQHELPGDVRHGLVQLALRSALGAVLGAAVVGLVVYRRPARALVTCGTAAVLLAGTAAGAAASWNSQAIAEPRYTGLLASAPSVVGDARSIVGDLDKYREQLAKVVTNVSRLYDASTTLPTYDTGTSLRVLHVSDIHLNPLAFDVIRSLVTQFSIEAVVDTGDIADHSFSAEERFVDQISTLPVPYVYVRGNHDSLAMQDAVARQRNAVVLDGTEATVAGVRFAGIGDPRFTPDKDTRSQGTPAAVLDAGQRLADLVTASPAAIALVHDPAAGKPLAGKVPLVLAGHTHQRAEHDLGSGTTLLVQGSTGGAGLRGLEPAGGPTSLECSILYLDRTTGWLQARDDVTVGGLGLTSISLTRHLVPQPGKAAAPPQSLWRWPAPGPHATGRQTALDATRRVP